jgi:hypothetical protein
MVIIYQKSKGLNNSLAFNICKVLPKKMVYDDWFYDDWFYDDEEDFDNDISQLDFLIGFIMLIILFPVLIIGAVVLGVVEWYKG